MQGSKHRYARIGDIIVATVKEAEPRKAVKRKDVVRALVVHQKQPFRRKSGIYLRFDKNAAVIVDKAGAPVGTRIVGPLPREIKERGYADVAKMVKTLI